MLSGILTLRRVQDNWNPDDTEIPKLHYDSFCRFDFVTEMEKIRSYKKANVPFIIYNMPDLDSTMERWSDLDYLNDKLGPFFPYPVDTSTNNHFMYAKVTYGVLTPMRLKMNYCTCIG